ncbi:MAG: hypothetical protein ABI723_06420 [Bacteroidia bacterium]
MNKSLQQSALAIFIAILIIACGNNQPKQTASSVLSNVKNDSVKVTLKLDTINKLEDQQDSVAIIKSPSGKYYTVYLADKDGNLVQARDAMMRSNDSLYCVTDLFLGHDRKKAKSTILTRGFQNYNSVAAFIATLQSDSIMRNLNPAISSLPNAPRVTQEKRNVKIKTAYIYAVRREDDNDFHIIIGDTLPFNAANALNVEIAGLPNPANTSTDTIQNVRTVVEAFFGEKCSGAYSTFSPPIPITVSGSLFYDIDHAPGIVGTGIYKPQTSWEIHPAKSFVFK